MLAVCNLLVMERFVTIVKFSLLIRFVETAKSFIDNVHDILVYRLIIDCLAIFIKMYDSGSLD